MKTQAIAFDFDGTLVDSGYDKHVNVMYAAYAACAATGYRRFLRPGDPDEDVRRALSGLLRYPGAPRFEQLAAMVRAFIDGRPEAFRAPAELRVGPELEREYEAVRREFDRVYSALNAAAARRYWRVFPGVPEAFRELSARNDLYIASGLAQDALDRDFAHHGLDRSLFAGVWGADPAGGDDKAELLRRVRARGYGGVLFVGDANRDLDYAKASGVRFFRVRGAADIPRLVVAVRRALPDEPEPWDWTEGERRVFFTTARGLVERLLAGRPMEPDEAADWVRAQAPGYDRISNTSA